ncbi:calmodulin-binding transcription activator 5 isoform X1 [Olea europaea subsp. europaea]|uniref:Calmodulin-binding transcription activator 5 isoform X1 n=1 Tax=Olea europaea subsp. europaea TaxID=158383 RepID=A0A8S0PTN2_OLEEU|nr:calmodulin-binding transcription activator 5 isoform X1 [Olea europaea subsp. europaea]
MEEAKTRWLRPNEIHSILRNYKYFTINLKPVNLPKSDTLREVEDWSIAHKLIEDNL